MTQTGLWTSPNESSHSDGEFNNGPLAFRIIFIVNYCSFLCRYQARAKHVTIALPIACVFWHCKFVLLYDTACNVHLHHYKYEFVEDFMSILQSPHTYPGPYQERRVAIAVCEFDIGPAMVYNSKCFNSNVGAQLYTRESFHAEPLRSQCMGTDTQDSGVISLVSIFLTLYLLN